MAACSVRRPDRTEVFVMLKKWLLALCVGGWAFSACAADGVAAPAAGQAAASQVVTPAAEKIVRQALGALSADVQIDSIQPAPMPGFYQVIAAGQLIYVSADGKYLLNGDLVDLTRKRNLSDAGWAAFRKAELAKVPASERIVFAPAHPKYTITVFTDVTCGYCRALHESMAAYNKEGIAVEYLAWPRDGVVNESGRPTSTYTEMVSVWCAVDRNASLTAAKHDHAPKAATCVNPVKQEYELGLRLGIEAMGTPAVFAEDGSMIGGYLSPAEMLDAVQKHSSAGG
jgi:thiol:disulfide interchange protein DsbC